MKTVFKLTVLLILSGCNLAGDSTNTILTEILNQNGSKKAILFLKEGGTTVSNSYQLTIADGAYKLKTSEAGNTFIADDDHGITNLDSTSIQLLWIMNDSLKVTYNKKLRTYIQRLKVNGVGVLYDPR
jgi:hypothetical protein